MHGLRLPLAAAIAVALVDPALAHTVGTVRLDLLGGLAHPLAGIDHILAMIAVGVWAAQLGGRAVWTVPLAFVAAMALAALAGAGGAAIPLVEPALAFSVIALGAAVALRVRIPIAMVAALTAAFGLVHGYAHGVEIPVADNAFGYGIGFVAATLFLHACGIALGRAGRGRLAERLGGAAIAVAGVALAV